MRRSLFEPEHIDFRDSVRRFIAEEVAPCQLQWEDDGIVPRELFAKAAAKGMLAIQVPERYRRRRDRRFPLQPGTSRS